MTDPTTTALDPWQQPDGWPKDAYFQTVAAALETAGIPVEDWWRDEDWDAAFTLAETAFRDGPLSDYAEITLIWRVQEECEPKHADDFEGLGWYWVPSRDPQAALGERAESLSLPYLAEPEQVAAAVRKIVTA